MTNPAKSHPNTTLSIVTGQLGAALIWLFGNVFHWSLSGEVSIEIATGLVAVALFIGRDGIRGAWRRLMDGKPAGP